MLRTWGLWVLLCAILAGCNINRDIMFKTPTDYTFDQVPDSLPPSFKIQPNDVLTFRIFSNDGFRMIDLVEEAASGARNLQRATFNYQVEFDGKAKLPLLGYVDVSGLTVRQAEMKLEKAYAEYYNRPYVQLGVSNRRVVVFPGGGGDAKVVQLENSNTTLMEAMAQAGGVAKRGDSRKVKLFRKNQDKPRSVYEFNLSDIDGLPSADMVLQADDIIYVQPNPEIAREVLTVINPFITLLTTTVLVIGIVKGISK